MGDLVQANLELHEELGREVRINLENEAKIRRLERQQARYEEDIQYLYGIIEKLESQKKYDEKELHSLRAQLAESHTRLKNAEKLCDEKEKFILFRESQLLESEDIIHELKQKISGLSDMARTREGPIPLESLSNDQLLGEIQTHSENLYAYATGRTPNVRTAQRSRDRIQEASGALNNRLTNHIAQRTAIEERDRELIENNDNLLIENAQLRNENHMLEQSIEGLKVEAERNKDFNREKLADVMSELLNRRNITTKLENNLETLLRESERLETNYEMLTNELQRNLDHARTVIAERDIIINQYRNRIRNYQDERTLLTARFGAEQLLTRRLTRQRLALRIANRQLQIRLMNPPVVIPPPIPQPPLPNISWLMLH